MKDRLRSGPGDWSSGKYERWSSSASSGSVGIGYDNRPGFSSTGSNLESWESVPSDSSSLVSPRVQVFGCGCVEN
ncbi:hypothetical protein PIB30_056751 [Stylosanthes scabra]|uniref:Uncharacterized protein n=1 Tax=Stylosanthes scabra TaxID=79078 RepID=A0ABU6RK62_9FABA|nr:hypothetical protein [Stylosanthes scabra]